MEENKKTKSSLRKGTMAYEHFKAYQRQYAKTHKKDKTVLAIILNKERDADIVEYRKRFPKQWGAYVKRLIRADMAKSK